jgi:outer membrane protein assembly factor BamB
VFAKKQPKNLFRLLLISSALGFPTAGLHADWPQILGSHRDAIAVNESLLETWPEEGPQQLWSRDVGEGYAGPAVKDGRVIVFHALGREQLVEALDAATGKLIWKRTLPLNYTGGGPDPDRGPKCVPLIDGDRIFLFDAGGFLYCLNFADGDGIWKRDLSNEFKAPLGYFGAGSTPIIVSGKLLVNVGGDDAAVVAFDPTNGETLWKSFDDRASYSSPTVMTIGDQTIAVFVTRLHLIGLLPDDGKVLFELPFGQRGPTVNGAMPVIVDDHIFINAAYNIGGRWIQISKTGDEFDAKVEWSNVASFSSQYSTPVYYDGFLYGTAGREDENSGSFRCVQAGTGEVKWKTKTFPLGHAILVGDKLLVLDCFGSLHLIKATPEKFDRVAKALVVKGKSRALPALADGRLYFRSNGPQGKLICLQVGEIK